MTQWYQIPKKENLTFEEKALNTSIGFNKFTYSVLKAMDGFAINTEQFKMLQLQYFSLITNEDTKKYLTHEKFITYLKNAGLIEHVSKKETAYKDKTKKGSYYKGMYYTATEKARLFIDKMKGQFEIS